IILVTEAGYHGIVALSACSTLPVSASTTSSASAEAARGAIAATAAATRIHFKDGLRSSGRRKCTFTFRFFETRLRQGGPVIDVRVSSVSGAAACGSANLYRLAGPEQSFND